MQEFGTWLGDAIYGMGIMIDQIKSLPGMGFVDKLMGGQGFLKTFSPLVRVLDQFSKMGAAGKPIEGRASEHTGRLGFVDPNAAARKKSEADAAKRNKALADMKKKELDTQKKSNALTKAAKTIDLDRIGMVAALKGKISETDRLSLNLQLALLDNNDEKATKLSKELSEAVKRQNDLDAALRNTAEAPNPYRNWKAPDVTPVSFPTFNVPSGGIAPKMAADYLGLAAIAGAGSENIVNVVVNLDGDVVGGAVTNTQVNQSLSGTFSDVSRYNGRGAPSIK
jgi:hypothetical protein